MFRECQCNVFQTINNDNIYKSKREREREREITENLIKTLRNTSIIYKQNQVQLEFTQEKGTIS